MGRNWKRKVRDKRNDYNYCGLPLWSSRQANAGIKVCMHLCVHTHVKDIDVKCNKPIIRRGGKNLGNENSLR